jgi:hypothetical protein
MTSTRVRDLPVSGALTGTEKLYADNGSDVYITTNQISDLAVAAVGTVAVANGGTGQTTEAEAVGELIQALTADATPDNAADYLATYDASADTGKKVLLSTIVPAKVTGDVTYYVRTDGSDSNTGLADTAGGAFLTIQKAINTVEALDFNFNTTAQVTIQIANGTYDTASSTGGIKLGTPFNFVSHEASDTGELTTVLVKAVLIRGDPTTPSNVVIKNTYNTGSSNVNVSVVGKAWRFDGVQINAHGGFGRGLVMGHGSHVVLGSCVFHSETANASCIHMKSASYLEWTYEADLTISGSARRFIFSQGGLVNMQGDAITISGTPTYSAEFIYVSFGATVVWAPVSTTGNITGQPYLVDMDGLLDLLGPAVASLPTGTIASGVEGNGQVYSEGQIYHGRFFWRDANATQTAHALRSGSGTVAQLPLGTAVGAGGRSFVTDASTNTFASQVVGGSTYAVPVYTLGTTAWFIG